MKRFCMPADFKTQTIEGYDRLHQAYEDSRVVETFGNITVNNVMGSGRSVVHLPVTDMAKLEGYVRDSKELDIDFAYTINASHMHNTEFTEEGVRAIEGFLKRLRDVGVRSLIIAMPSLLELVKTLGLAFEIKTSVIAQVTNANKAVAFRKMGADRITIDESVNRDFGTLERIRKAIGNRMEIIVNSVCHQDCWYRMFHYNQIASDSVDVCSDVSSGYFPRRCVWRLYGDPSCYFKSTWIRPEDLHYYTDAGIEYFKLQGRQSVLRGDPVRAVECYFKERYDGDLTKLLYLFGPPESVRLAVDNKSLDGFLDPFVKNDTFCTRDCQNCGYCERLAARHFGDEQSQNAVRSSLAALAENDPFRKMVGSATRAQ